MLPTCYLTVPYVQTEVMTSSGRSSPQTLLLPQNEKGRSIVPLGDCERQETATKKPVIRNASLAIITIKNMIAVVGAMYSIQMSITARNSSR